MSSRVGAQGRITIAKAIRESLEISAGDETVQSVENGRIVIEVVPVRHRRSLAGNLKAKVAHRPTNESWKALRRAAWEMADPDRSGTMVSDVTREAIAERLSGASCES